MDALTLSESRRLVELEEIVEKAIGQFLAVGKALLEIRDSGLYRIEHKTFEEYVQKRWKFSRSYAYRLISAQAESEMSPMGDKPKTEREARARKEKRKAAELTVDAESGELSGDGKPSDADGAGEPEESPRVRSASDEWAASGLKPDDLLAARVRDIEIAREEELLLGKREWLEALAAEHEESARLLREKASEL